MNEWIALDAEITALRALVVALLLASPQKDRIIAGYREASLAANEIQLGSETPDELIEAAKTAQAALLHAIDLKPTR